MNKTILKLAIPNVISNITVPFVGIVDIALMGRMGSPAFIGGVGFGTMLFTLIYSGLGFLRMGTTGMTAQEYGASNFRESSNILSRAMILSILLGFGLIALQIPIEKVLISNLDGSKEALGLAAEYFRYRIWAAPATLSVFVFMGWFIGMQNAKIPMYVTLIISGLNIIISSILVLGFDLGIKGVAIGTVVSQYVGLISSVIFYQTIFKRSSNFFNLKKTLNFDALKKFFSVNSDILIRSILLTGSFFYFNAISATFGDNILALNSVMLQFLWFFAYVMDGFAYAGGTLTGRYIGERDLVSLKLVIRKSLMFSVLFSLFFSICYVLFGSGLFSLLTDNAIVLGLLNEYIYWIWILPMVSFGAFLYDEIFIGATATRTMRNVMLVVVLVFYLPALLIFKFYFGNHGMWLAISIMLFARGVGLHLFVKKSIYSKLLTPNNNAIN